MPKIEQCRVCRSKDLDEIYNFPHVPYGDLYQGSIESALSLKKNKLNLIFCKNCNLLQLDEDTEIELQYKNYLYNTKITNSLFDYYRYLINNLTSQFPGLDKNCIDIGCNDGSLIKIMKSKGFETIGVEPAENLSSNLEKQNLTVFNEFFSDQLACEIVNQHGKFDFIFINYVLANVSDIHNFLNGVKILMHENSVICVTTGYHPDQFLVNMFDYINHDHIFYFTLKNLEDLFMMYGVEMIDAFRIEQKGGSVIGIFTSSKNKLDGYSGQVNQLLQRENWLHVHERNFYSDFIRRIEEQKKNSLKYMYSLKKSVFAVGASISSTYLLSYFEISEFIDSIFDDDIIKFGKFAPGSGLLVRNLAEVALNNNVDLYLLAWQHTNKMITRLKALNFRGNIAIPLPQFKIINL